MIPLVLLVFVFVTAYVILSLLKRRNDDQESPLKTKYYRENIDAYHEYRLQSGKEAQLKAYQHLVAAITFLALSQKAGSKRKAKYQQLVEMYEEDFERLNAPPPQWIEHDALAPHH